MRGSITDIIFIIVLFFVASLTFLFAWTITDAFQSEAVLNSTLAQHNITFVGTAKDNITSFDGLSILLIVGLIGGSAISAFFIRSHPIFIIILLLLSGIFLLLSAEFANIFDEFATDGALSDATNQFPITKTIMDNLPLFTVGGIIVIGMALFAGIRREPGGFGGGI